MTNLPLKPGPKNQFKKAQLTIYTKSGKLYCAIGRLRIEILTLRIKYYIYLILCNIYNTVSKYRGVSPDA